MIKFAATSPNGRKILGIGLSYGNLDRLKAGNPIHFNAEEMGLPGFYFDEVLIYAGATEESMCRDLQESGFIGADTIINKERQVQ